MGLKLWDGNLKSIDLIVWRAIFGMMAVFVGEIDGGRVDCWYGDVSLLRRSAAHVII